MQLKIYPWDLAIAKLASMPAMETLSGSAFLSITKTPDELSLVCEAQYVPADAIAVHADWRCLGVVGVLDFALTGILAPIAQCLAEHRISIFAISSYDTDFILVKADALKAACDALKAANYEMVGEESC